MSEARVPLVQQYLGVERSPAVFLGLRSSILQNEQLKIHIPLGRPYFRFNLITFHRAKEPFFF